MTPDVAVYWLGSCFLAGSLVGLMARFFRVRG